MRDMRISAEAAELRDEEGRVMWDGRTAKVLHAIAAATMRMADQMCLFVWLCPLETHARTHHQHTRKKCEILIFVVLAQFHSSGCQRPAWVYGWRIAYAREARVHYAENNIPFSCWVAAHHTQMHAHTDTYSGQTKGAQEVGEQNAPHSSNPGTNILFTANYDICIRTQIKMSECTGNSHRHGLHVGAGGLRCQNLGWYLYRYYHRNVQFLCGINNNNTIRSESLIYGMTNQRFGQQLL